MRSTLQKAFRKVRQLVGPPLPDVIRRVQADRLTYLPENALAELYERVSQIEKSSLPGILIEAGCALGGSAIVLASAKSPARPLFVYDVFGLIPPPSEKDGSDVLDRYTVIESGKAEGIAGDTYYGYREDLHAQVTANFRAQGVPVETNNVHLIKGLFEDTLCVDQPVALAHLDGDWYESVRTCLERIEPHLVPGGTLVIDDYDAWSGCRRAVDEYFADKKDRYDFRFKSRLHIVRR